jgi:antitoxin component YwqK of YwqJK toxin-antitoxin module
MEETSYKQNLKEGVYKKYAENGIVLEETTFQNNDITDHDFKDADGNVSKGSLYCKKAVSGNLKRKTSQRN